VAAIAVDITAQREAEEALRLSEERLRHATEGSGVGTYDLNLSTGRGVWSRTAFALLGLDPPDDLEGSYDLWRSAIHPQDVERAEAEHAAAVAEGRVWTMEYRTARPVDRPRWLQAYGHFETHPNGDIRSIGVVTDITERKVWEEHQRLLVAELNHRVKNTLAVVQGLAFQTFRAFDDAAPVKAFEGRLMALAAAHTMLTDQNWEAADLDELMRGAFAAHGVGASRAAFAGPPIRISPEPAVTLTLVMHELATNALKYGALSDNGRVEVTWRLSVPNLELEWRERGGPLTREPERRGFGTRMIERAFTQQLGGRVNLEFAPEGLIARMAAPLERVKGIEPSS
jgi:two-component sensor histidine kinase